MHRLDPAPARVAADVPLRPLRLRAPIWGIFVVALITALLVPVTDLWLTWQTPISVQISLDPPQPKLGQVAQLVVTLYHDSATMAHSTALDVALDMQGMAMALPPLHIAAAGARYQTSLPFTMTGIWQIDLHLQLPAHAPWHSALHVQVQGDRVALLTSGAAP